MVDTSLRRLITMALEEDIGAGDITTELLVDPETPGVGRIVSEEPLVVAGLFVALEVFRILDADLDVFQSRKEGEFVPAGTVVFEAKGKLRSLLTGERTALNFLQRLSGIATFTAAYVKAGTNKNTKILDTRKTTPLWRVLEKHAVRMGGGNNHRMGLYDGILIKDNHIKVCGSISNAITRIRRNAPHLLRIEVEVSNLEQVREALDAGADVIMLDNMDIPQIRKAMKRIKGRALVEMSGSIRREKLPALVDLSLDFISVGALTHSAPAVDLSMDIEPFE